MFGGWELMSCRTAWRDDRGAKGVGPRCPSAVMVLLLVALWTAACDMTEPRELCTTASLTSPTRILTHRGDTLTMTADFQVLGSPGQPAAPPCARPPGTLLVWRVSDTTVAVIEEDTTLARFDTTALVVARGEGTAFVRAEAVQPGEEFRGCTPGAICGLSVIVDFPDGVEETGRKVSVAGEVGFRR